MAMLAYPFYPQPVPQEFLMVQYGSLPEFEYPVSKTPWSRSVPHIEEFKTPEEYN
jgi:hypothetical protein